MKLLIIYNFASHYRAPIFQMMEKEFHCDFVFGDNVAGNIKQLDVSTLKGKVTMVHNVLWRHCYYQQGVPKLIRKDYDTFIILGETRCIST